MGKINLKMQVRPKFFWASLIVFLFGTSVVFFLLKENEEDLKILFQKQFLRTTKEKTMIERKLIDTSLAKKRIEEELVTEKDRSLTLEKVVEEKEKQINLTLDKLEKEIVARRQAEAELLIAMREKSVLETTLKEITDTPMTVELEKIVIKAVPGSVGRILEVNKEHGFVVVDLGRRNSLRLGDIFSIYRDDAFVGSVEVERIEEDICAAAVLPRWNVEEFREEDKVW